MNTKKHHKIIRFPALLPIFLCCIVFPLFPQSSTTIAILDFTGDDGLPKNTGRIIAEKLRSAFRVNQDIVVFDQWLIDTMASGQGSLQLLKCREESCLLAIGHLLVADVVVDGSIVAKNDNYIISIKPVDVKKNASMPIVQRSVKDLTEKSLIIALASVPDEVLIRLTQPSDTAHRDSADKKNEPVSPPPKKPSLVKKILFSTLAVAVIGGAAGGGYYYKSNRGNDGGPTPSVNNPDNPTPDVPLSDMPKHPSE